MGGDLATSLETSLEKKFRLSCSLQTPATIGRKTVAGKDRHWERLSLEKTVKWERCNGRDDATMQPKSYTETISQGHESLALSERHRPETGQSPWARCNEMD